MIKKTECSQFKVWPGLQQGIAVHVKTVFAFLKLCWKTRAVPYRNTNQKRLFQDNMSEIFHIFKN